MSTPFDQRHQRVEKQYNTVKIYSEPITFPKALSAQIPRLAPDKIVGRETDLTDLHQRLCDQRQVVLVNGMGGIGKTTLAQVYVAQYWEEYHHVVWISQTSDNVLNDFINTEGLLGRLGIQADGQEAQELFDQLMMALDKLTDEPNLLVIDNAEAALRDVYAYLPAQPKWHVLVTSRQHIENFDIKELEFLTEDDAVELFSRHYTRGKLLPEEIRSIVKFVDLHTLTIEILAKTAQTQRTEFNRLTQAIADDLKANVYVPHKGKKIDRVMSYLSSIFTLSDLTDEELWLLKQFLCLPAELHSYDLLEALVYPEASQREAIFAETLETLTAAGWLLKNQATDSYKLHRIIADVMKTQHEIAVTDVEPLIGRVTEQLSLDQSRENPIKKFPWIPFGQAILAIFPNSDLAAIATLQNNLALRLQDLGDYQGAKTLLEQALRSDEQNFGPDHPNTARSASNLALVLQDLGDYQGAKTLLEQALRSAEQNFGPDHPTTAVRSSNLALVLKDLGDYQGALTLSEKALDIFLTVLPQGHPYIQRVSAIYQSIKSNLGE